METLISAAQVRIAAQHPLLWAHLSQGEHISKHTRSQSCTSYPGWTCLGTALLQIKVIACNVFPPSTFPGCPVFSLEGYCVMCLSLFPPVLGPVLFNDAVTQTGSHNSKGSLSGDDFRAIPSCVVAGSVTTLSLSGCAVLL